MKADFSDIKEKIPQTPIWYDENGVPRYCIFEPKFCPDIYADEVLLLVIECQNCGNNYHVQISSMRSHNMLRNSMLDIKTPTTFQDNMAQGFLDVIDYGDPPIHGCTGDVMSTYTLKIVQFWSRLNKKHEWKRIKKLEISIPNLKNEQMEV